MEKNPTRQAGYRLVARFSGSRLTIDARLRWELENDVFERIETIRRSRALRDGEQRALAESVEWERLGDLRLLADARLGAVQAYRRAAECCLRDGEGTPLRPLRRRIAALRSKMETAAGDDERLRGLLPRER